jgi:hypothetical protein
VTELVEYKQSVEYSLFRNESIKIMKGMTAENLTVISEMLDAASRETVRSWGS